MWTAEDAFADELETLDTLSDAIEAVLPVRPEPARLTPGIPSRAAPGLMVLEITGICGNGGKGLGQGRKAQGQPVGREMSYKFVADKLTNGTTIRLSNRQKRFSGR
jgi:hypothetical protein